MKSLVYYQAPQQICWSRCTLYCSALSLDALAAIISLGFEITNHTLEIHFRLTSLEYLRGVIGDIRTIAVGQNQTDSSRALNNL